jgi:hypothetical protein
MTTNFRNRNGHKVELTVSTLEDGRRHVEVFYPDNRRSDYNPHGYTTARNIDGSNRFMSDKGLWSFLPHELEKPVADAFRAL